MSYPIDCPAMFEGNSISADVIITICQYLKSANIDIEETILDKIVPERECLDRSSILNEVSNHFSTNILDIVPNHEDFDSSYILNKISTFLFNEKSFDSLIFVKKHKQSLKSSIAFLLTGNSNKQDIVESSKLISDWELNDDDPLFRDMKFDRNI